jgi:hypothetical protein
MPALVARPRRVPRLFLRQVSDLYALEEGFVFNDRLKLPERHAVKPPVQLLGPLDVVPYSVQVFHHDYWFGELLSVSDYLVRYDV